MWLGPAPVVPSIPSAFRTTGAGSGLFRRADDELGVACPEVVRWALNVKTPTAVAAMGGRYELKDGGQTPDVQDDL